VFTIHPSKDTSGRHDPGTKQRFNRKMHHLGHSLN
jgi:hypothetical protein